MKELSSFFVSCITVASVSALDQLLFDPKNAYQRISGGGPTLPVDLSPLYNNRGFGMTANESNFDGHHNAYPAQYMPPSEFQYYGVNFSFPKYTPSGNDNVVSLGQNVSIPQGKYSAVYMLASADNGVVSGNLTAVYSDGSTTSADVLVPSWWAWPVPPGGDIIFPCYLSNQDVDYNRSYIFLTVNWLDPTKHLTSLMLPSVSSGAAPYPGGASEDAALHVFSLSLSGPIPEQPLEAASSDGADVSARSADWTQYVGPALQIRYARSTRLFMDDNGTQIVEATIANVGSTPILNSHDCWVTISSTGLEAVQDATIVRLMPGDQTTVQIGVRNKDGANPGDFGPATILTSGWGLARAEYTFNATYGMAPYEATYASIYEHESPQWFDDAKYGVFIHWGVYAVPAWGNTGQNESYAEWYWWNLNKGPGKPDQTYEYHLQHYGPDVVYDDFIQNFTASAWNPQEWVDLFADSGAQYFVQVSKHHDGYAIFDMPANVSERTSVVQNPHRNLLGELFNASELYQPQMRRGTYYSLPEWFNPDYQKYGFSSWPGDNATNPFTNATLPYTGYVPVDDYLTGIMLPQMNTLAEMGTEIMWCDIGGPNVTLEFASNWFNKQAAQGRQVTMNSRCGTPGDFDTPEYQRYNTVQRRKWECNVGMDPFSYGYNAATPLDAYLNASAVVTSLVDIVSKNGNFLLNVGPLPNGTILQREQDTLRDAGSWIKNHAEAIFNTTYWFVTPQEGPDIRFTRTRDAFYVLLLTKPGPTLTLHSPVPWIGGDKVTVVGGNKAGSEVPVQRMQDWSLVLTLGHDIAEADQYTWVFKITYS